MWSSCDNLGSSVSDSNKLFDCICYPGFTCLVCILVSLSRNNEREGGRSHGTAKDGTCFLRRSPLLIGILMSHVQHIGFCQVSD